MKQLLIIAEQYYPLMVPGAFRVGSFAKYLPNFNFQPTILAPNWTAETAKFAAHGRESAYIPLAEQLSPVAINKYPINCFHENRTLHLVKSLIRPQFGRMHNTKNVVSAALKLFENQQFDAVLASGPPHFVWQAAKEISRKKHIPWVADIRDVSGQIPGIKSQNLFVRALREGIQAERRFLNAEKVLLEDAAAKITVSDPLRQLLESRGLSNVHVILNGFDEEEHQVTRHKFPKFTILHAGTVHKYRPAGVLLDALDDICKESPQIANTIAIYFYGDEKNLQSELSTRSCKSLFEFRPTIPKSELLPLLHGANVLLHLTTPGAKGIMTSKITEYLGARRPILTVPGDGDCVDALLSETGSGKSCGSPAEAKKFLISEWENWRMGRDSNYAPRSETLGVFTRRVQCQRLSQILNQIL